MQEVNSTNYHSQPLVTVGIPTFNRSTYLSEALASCAKQTYEHIEVIVSDDSNQEKEKIKNSDLVAKYGYQYVYNEIPLRQAKNVNQLFDMAKGKYFVLLHDDDLLEPKAITNMVGIAEQSPRVVLVYGCNIIINPDGTVNGEKTLAVNQTYGKDGANFGSVHPAWAALIQQVPPDGYLIRTEIARTVRMNPDVENSCDLDFCVRLALKSEDQAFVCLPENTSRYRTGHESVCSQFKDLNHNFEIYQQNKFPVEFTELWKWKLRTTAPWIFRVLVRCGEHQRALAIYFSPYFPWQARLAPKNIVAIGILMTRLIGIELQLLR